MIIMKKIILVSVFSLLFFGFDKAMAVSLYFYPQQVSLNKGETAILELRINTDNDLINAVEVFGKASKEVQIESVEAVNSVLRLFIESKVENGGYLVIGGTPNGFSGEGVLVRMLVRAVSDGMGVISIEDASKALLNDGLGSSASVKVGRAEILVSQRAQEYILITSKSHPDESKWFNPKDLLLHWDLEEGASYSYLLSQDPLAKPDDVADTPEGDKEFLGDVRIPDLKDGIHYFTLKFVGSDIVSRYRVMQDRTSPEWIEAEIKEGARQTGNLPFVSFYAVDFLSGIDYYEASINGRPFERVSSPLVLSEAPRLIVLKAFDRASNSAITTIKGKTEFTDLLWTFALLVLLLALLAAYVLLSKKRKEN